MTYARITAGTIDALGNPPDLEWDGTRWWDLRDPTIRTARGWIEVTETPRPEPVEGGVWESIGITGVQLVDGLPVRAWTWRAWTAEELAAQEEAEQQQADRAAIVEQALVWLAQDAAQADTRAGQIAAALTDVDAQIAQVAAYTFSGSNVAQINASLNNALKPMVESILTRQRQIGLMLQELQVARNRHGDALVWVGRYLTR